MRVVEETHDYSYRRTKGGLCQVFYVTTTVTVDDRDRHTIVTVEEEIGVGATRVDAMHVADEHRAAHR